MLYDGINTEQYPWESSSRLDIQEIALLLQNTKGHLHFKTHIMTIWIIYVSMYVYVYVHIYTYTNMCFYEKRFLLKFWVANLS